MVIHHARGAKLYMGAEGRLTPPCPLCGNPAPFVELATGKPHCPKCTDGALDTTGYEVKPRKELPP